jgi:glycosyltransferase involved in cell wall biosynthesis
MSLTILSIGNLIERKGHRYLIKACQKVMIRPLSLVIIGEGKERENLLHQWEYGTYQDFGLNLVPRCTEKELKAWMEKADVFCLPSVTDKRGLKEGLGLVLIEAIKAGLPCVAFNNGGVCDIITHGVTGYICGEKNYNSMAFYIEMCAEGMINTTRAKQIINQKFDIETIRRRLNNQIRRAGAVG